MTVFDINENLEILAMQPMTDTCLEYKRLLNMPTSDFSLTIKKREALKEFYSKVNEKSLAVLRFEYAIKTIGKSDIEIFGYIRNCNINFCNEYKNKIQG